MRGLYVIASVVATGIAPEPARAPSNCVPTPREDRLPGVVAPMAGEHPVWLVDGGTATAGDTPVKTLWVLSRDAAGPLTVEGRRIDGDGTLRFRAGVEAPISDALVISDPSTRSIQPGGAPAEILDTYAFVPSYVLYPSVGCWELLIRLRETTRRVVVEAR